MNLSLFYSEDWPRLLDVDPLDRWCVTREGRINPTLRRLRADTLEALMQATQADAPERQALRAQRPPRPEYPEQCRGLCCEALTRAGTPCQRRDLGAGARCKLHGGRSTGPKTPEGKLRSAWNGFGKPRARTP